MNLNTSSAKELVTANLNVKEKEYWLNKLSGAPIKSTFPYDRKAGPGAWSGPLTGGPVKYNAVTFQLSGDLFSRLLGIANRDDRALHMILAAGLTLLLYKYDHGGSGDILLGTPIYKRESRDEFINTVLALRSRVENTMTFKELLVELRKTIVEAVEHQNYPMDVLARQLDRFPMFDVVLLLENIHDKSYILHTRPGLIFSFSRTHAAINAVIEYNPNLYDENSIEIIGAHYIKAMQEAAVNIDRKISGIDILLAEEKKRLLFDFNDTQADFPGDKTIHRLFAEQVARTPGNIAAVGPDGSEFTYRQLDRAADRLAGRLSSKGLRAGAAVGIMTEPSLPMVIGLMAVLKAGGAYLPIDPSLPPARVRHILADSGAPFLLAHRQEAMDLLPRVETVVTAPTCHIKDFDKLPIPDRSLIETRNYKNKIGMASVANSISIQATRGCPYKCIYCHKVWSKHHVFRSAENIFAEIHYFYKKGVRDFAFIDDCFNLDMKNSSRFFRLVLKNKLDIRIFFPNGLRGDIMTPQTIDLMVEAGCRGINLSLETASPRLQKLLKKHLDIEKFREVMVYIAEKHPEVVLEIATMHGFPTETEKEALMTLDFIKSIRWIHFPYIHILKIYPNTEMEALALEHGVSAEDIRRSRDLAFHELPATLPFPAGFTRQYQSDFMKDYFLLEERMRSVLPVQLNVMGEGAVVRKYDTYLPVEIKSPGDILEFCKISDIHRGEGQSLRERGQTEPPALFQAPPAVRQPIPGARRILLLDVTTHFSSYSMLYNVSEQPLGLMYLGTYIKQRFGAAFDIRIYKSGEDFDSFAELKQLADAFNPHLIGIRALTFYKEFFHETVAMLRHWGIDVPIIAGGPYATSDYDAILKDRNIDLAVLGEGETILAELLEKMLENDFKIPGSDVLSGINGLAFVRREARPGYTCEVILMDRAADVPVEIGDAPSLHLPDIPSHGLAYILFTSGTTGKPKGVMVEHRQVINCISWMQEVFKLGPRHQVIQRTPLNFDPSVWEIFWPLFYGARIRVLDADTGKDAAALIELLVSRDDITIMYCTASLVTAMVSFLRTNPPAKKLKLPYFLTGAEPIAMETIKTLYRFLDGEIVNTYGPTEGTINNTWYPFPRDDKRTVVPIGKPIANNYISIVSNDKQLMPIKAPGEIYIAGQSLARGYLNHPELTSERFHCLRRPGAPRRGEPICGGSVVLRYDDLFPSKPFHKKFCGGAGGGFSKEPPAFNKLPPPGGRRQYQTGDLGRWLVDGEIEILGRKDKQMKVRGYRVEPGEIEALLLERGDIDECIVIAADSSMWKKETRLCKSCGITSDYPNIAVHDDGYCQHCHNLNRYREDIDLYFKSPDELEKLIRQKSTGKPGAYHCLLLYNGGRGAGYALYRLVDMGLNVLTLSYDNGYFSPAGLRNIKTITGSLGVDNVVLTHPQSDEILKKSLQKSHTVCRGCFHISSALAVDYAMTHDIPVVVGATLSRGQIIENKLLPFLGKGINDPARLEAEVAEIAGSAVDVDKDIFDLIGIEAVSNKTARRSVSTVDFYRYCDIANTDMIDYLNHRDPYWKTRKEYAVYSTNCPIKQLGDFGVLRSEGFHYYGAATSWEKRLGHITLKNLEEDLACTVTANRHHRFLERFGLQPPSPAESIGGSYIAAYMVTRDNGADTVELREELGKKLPEYMIPSYFTVIDKIPLTTAGKIDYSALPDPRQAVARGTYIAPEDDIQQILAGTWEEILGVDRIGIDDNFFQVGGDSIKAIQVSAALASQRLKLEIRDFFANPTIRRLREFVKPIGGDTPPVPQGPVTGEIPFTPIQQWFMESFSPLYRHHFNQSVMLYRRSGFAESLLRELFSGLVRHHDALRIVLQPDENGILRQVNRPEAEPLFHLDVIAFDGCEENEKAIEAAAQQLQAAIQLEKGPLLKAGLFKTLQGDHLLIVVHHLAVDGISWRILLEDLETGYRMIEAGETPEFPLKTSSFRDWALKLREYARSETALRELEYWKTVEATEVEPLPLDFQPPAKVTMETIDNVSIHFNENDTGALSGEVNRAYNTEINDILLSALALALDEWKGLRRVCINLEGHGRESILEGINLARTVGWFTSMYPVVLDTGAADGPGEKIKTIKETLRKIPNRGIGYGILRYLTPEEKKQGTKLAIEPRLRFNYLGEFGQEKGASAGITSMSPLNKGDSLSPLSEQHYPLEINGMTANGTLSFTFSYNTLQFKRETVVRLAACFESGMQEIIRHCLSMEESELTASDYSGADLDESEVAAVFDELDLE